jgi:hypothetical protein
MNATELRDWIDSLTDDIEFQYNGVWGGILPTSRENIILFYKDEDITVHSVEEAMNTPFIEGHTLIEICEKIVV